MGKQTRRARHDRVAGPVVPADTRLRATGADGAVGLLFGIAGTLFGLSVGYMIGTPPISNGAATQVAPAAPGASTDTNLVDERELAALREVLARDPENLNAAVTLGNRLYDARRYAEAVPYFRTAMRIDPANANVSTDLGTALYYSGRPDEALSQYEHSLSIDDSHAQTLFNIGIVSFEGKGDARRAIDSWERLLSRHPAYPDRARVEELLTQARQRAGN